MSNLAEEQIQEPKMLAFLLSLFAALALVLASVGVYGVISHSVTSQIPEIGIRMALGATRKHVASQVFVQTWINIGLGLTLGVAVAFGLRSFVASQVYGLEPTDPTTLLGAAFLLSIIAIFATLMPALRAARIQPGRALRRE